MTVKPTTNAPQEDREGLRCPRCNSAWSRVLKTCHVGMMIRRYRECRHCNKRFVTAERVKY